VSGETREPARLVRLCRAGGQACVLGRHLALQAFIGERCGAPITEGMGTGRTLVRGPRMGTDTGRKVVENIPSDVAGEWVTTDGHARVQVLPKGDPEDTEVLRGFATSVLAVEPNATGPEAEAQEHHTLFAPRQRFARIALVTLQVLDHAALPEGGDLRGAALGALRGDRGGRLGLFDFFWRLFGLLGDDCRRTNITSCYNNSEITRITGAPTVLTFSVYRLKRRGVSTTYNC
jgi:hypothetical protein